VRGWSCIWNSTALEHYQRKTECCLKISQSGINLENNDQSHCRSGNKLAPILTSQNTAPTMMSPPPHNVCAAASFLQSCYRFIGNNYS
jgi:hypothetical protein